MWERVQKRGSFVTDVCVCVCVCLACNWWKHFSLTNCLLHVAWIVRDDCMQNRQLIRSVANCWNTKRVTTIMTTFRNKHCTTCMRRTDDKEWSAHDSVLSLSPSSSSWHRCWEESRCIISTTFKFDLETFFNFFSLSSRTETQKQRERERDDA